MRQNRIPVLKDCAVPNCPEVALTKGLCRKHYQAMKRDEKKAPPRAPDELKQMGAA